MHNNRNQILQWAESGLFDAKDIEQVIQVAEAEPQPDEWLNFLKMGFLWAAVISLSAGLIFFFAYNWQDMGRFAKFTLVEMVMLLATIAYIRIARTQLLTAATLMGMSLFTGALLALVGQTYQTGADPWQLFAIWAVLILPWTFIAGVSSLWILWVVLVNLSVALYLDVSHGIFGILFTDEVSLWTIALLNTFLMCLFEYRSFMRDNNKMVRSRYVNHFLAIIAGTAVSFLAMWSIFEHKVELTGFLFYIGWIACIFYVYRYRVHDLFILSMGSLSVIIILVSLLIKALDNNLDEGGFLFISLTIIGLSTLAGIWLKNLSKEFAQGDDS